MFVRNVCFFVLICVLLNAQTRGEGSCDEDDDCSRNEVCCRSKWGGKKCTASCLFKYCINNIDCKGFSCCNKKCRHSCVGQSCTQQSDCGGEPCRNEVCRESRAEQSCYYQSDCDENTHCCNDTCHESCTGRSCSRHSHCYGSNVYCCNNVCKTGTCGFASWVIAVVVLSVLAVMGTIVFCVYVKCRKSSGLPFNSFQLLPVPGGQPQTSTAVDADQNVLLNYPQGPPPAYQLSQPATRPLQGQQSAFQQSEPAVQIPESRKI